MPLFGQVIIKIYFRHTIHLTFGFLNQEYSWDFLKKNSLFGENKNFENR